MTEKKKHKKPENVCQLGLWVDKEQKEKVEKILADMDLSLSHAVRLFFRQCIIENGLPFRLSVRSEEKE